MRINAEIWIWIRDHFWLRSDASEQPSWTIIYLLTYLLTYGGDVLGAGCMAAWVVLVRCLAPMSWIGISRSGGCGSSLERGTCVACEMSRRRSMTSCFLKPSTLSRMLTSSDHKSLFQTGQPLAIRTHVTLTLYGHIKTAQQRTIIQQCGDWYTGRWWVGCYIWYSEDGPGWAAAPPRPLLAVLNVTSHPSMASVPTSYYSVRHYSCLCTLKGQQVDQCKTDTVSRQWY